MDSLPSWRYAEGVGMVLEIKVAGGMGRLDLVSFDPGR